MAISPRETYSPLVVDPDAELAFPIAFEFLQPIRRWHPKIRKRRCRVKHE
jgi:hypothetical protein